MECITYTQRDSIGYTIREYSLIFPGERKQMMLREEKIGGAYDQEDNDVGEEDPFKKGEEHTESYQCYQS